MSSRNIPLIGFLGCMLTLPGCSTDAPPIPTDPAVQVSPAERAAKGVEQSVTGSAFITLEDFGGIRERFTLHAKRDRDGTVSGTLTGFSTQGTGVKIRVAVTCFGIAPWPPGGVYANLGGVVTESSDPAFLGLNVVWAVIDRGEGANAPPDLESDLFGASPEDLQRVCGLEEGLFVVPSERGNIQIRP